MINEIEKNKNKIFQYDNTVLTWETDFGEYPNNPNIENIKYILSLFDKNKKLSKFSWLLLNEFDLENFALYTKPIIEAIKYLYNKKIEIEIITCGSDYIVPFNDWGFTPKITYFNYCIFVTYCNFFSIIYPEFHITEPQNLRDCLLSDNSFLIDNCGLRPGITEYKHYFTSLNNRPRPHRIQTMDLLAKYDLIDGNAISFLAEGSSLKTLNFSIWKPKILKLSDGYKYPSAVSFTGNEYLDSFAQLITETTDQCFFLTEKTLLPLMIGKPFIACNIQGFHKILKRLGFELYDEIFDYSFDSEPDQTKRFDMAIQNFVELSKIPKKDLKHLYNKVRDKLLFNRMKTLAIPTDINSYPDEIKEAIYYQIKNNLPLLPFVDHDIKL